MCYQVEVLEYNEDKAIVTVGESKFIAYHDTDTEVTEASMIAGAIAANAITHAQTASMKFMLAPS